MQAGTWNDQQTMTKEEKKALAKEEKHMLMMEHLLSLPEFSPIFTKCQ